MNWSDKCFMTDEERFVLGERAESAVFVPPVKPASRFPGRLAATVYGFLAMLVAFTAGINMFTTGTFFGDLNDVNPVVGVFVPVFGVGAVLGFLLTILWVVMARSASVVDRVVGGAVGAIIALGFGWLYAVYSGVFPGL